MCLLSTGSFSVNRLCPVGCTTCSAANGCLSCKPRLFFHLELDGMRQKGVCLSSCPRGYYGKRSPQISTCNSKQRRRVSPPDQWHQNHKSYQPLLFLLVCRVQRRMPFLFQRTLLHTLPSRSLPVLGEMWNLLSTWADGKHDAEGVHRWTTAHH